MMTLILAALLPAWEMRVIDSVSVRYGLTKHERQLLCAIRKTENGTRIYYGVDHPRCVGYESQCRWAANTIRLRYTGDLDAFAARWCPYNTETRKRNVRWFMRMQGGAK